MARLRPAPPSRHDTRRSDIASLVGTAVDYWLLVDGVFRRVFDERELSVGASNSGGVVARLAGARIRAAPHDEAVTLFFFQMIVDPPCPPLFANPSRSD